MQQQERGGSSEERKQQQDRRSKPMMQGGGGGGGSEQQQPPPQKCPRCESLNTKFCYYNNYSLSQPRYFCKACRRYWTQGGTLRNVPVGGGCRKGKRTKTSTVAGGGETSQANNQHKPPTQQQPHHPNLTSQQNFLSSIGPPVFRTSKDDPTAGNLVAAHSSISSMGSYYYPTGGFLSSLAAIQPQSFNPHPLHQSLNIGGADDHHNNIGGSSNLGLLQGFSVPSFGSTQHQHSQQHHPQIYQMGNRENNSMNHPMYHNPSEESLIQSGRPGNSYQGFINNTNNPNVPDTTAAMWSISSTSSGNTNSNTNIGSASGSLSPNQWPDLPGYGPSSP